MTTQRTPPPYSETQATAWLAWLAYHMRRRDITIFQIESLQPDWLMGRQATALHLLLTHTLWGMWTGLIFGLIFGLNGGLIGGLSGGLIFGIIFGLSERVIPVHKLDAFLQNQDDPTRSLVTGTLLGGLSVGLIVGLIFGLIFRLSAGLSAGLIIGLPVGLIFGFIRTSRVALRKPSGCIRTIESLRWSWQNVRQNAIKGAKIGLGIGVSVGLSVGLIVWVIVWVIFGPSDGRIAGVIIGLGGPLVGGSVGGLVGGLVGGFQPGAEELKTRPNQGIWLTIRSAFKIGLPFGLIGGSLFWFSSASIIQGLLYGASICLVIGSWYGGLDAIEHGIVRFILAWRGHAPLNYARFLDYAAEELQFLQKVGGGYIFIHRYLLEHFAELAVEKGYVAGEAERPPT